MKNNLIFHFTVDKENKTVKVEREFEANLDLVWDAWTKPELIDQWWAPLPYKNVTKSMEFKEGGTWLYYMIGPENQIHWCKNDYLKINPKQSFKGLDAFCDENGTTNPNMPRTEWLNTFTLVESDKTLISVVGTYEKLSDLEMVIEMGFKEGFTMALEQLDNVLKKLNQSK